jgi:MFS family permease
MTVETPARQGFDRGLIAPMILGAILNPVNSAMIAVALVPIAMAFDATPAETSWLVTALYIATAIGQPLTGRLVDAFGPRPLYLIGTGLTGIAGLIGTFAPSLSVLIIARVLLGLGTCAGYPAAMYLIRSESVRTGQDSPGGILTALAVSGQTIAVIGPSLGGFLVEFGGWHTIFAVNVPLSVACLILGTWKLPRVAPIEKKTTEVVAGKRFPFPLLVTYARAVLTYTVSYGFLYGFTQWLEQGRGLSPSIAGLILLPIFGTAIVMSTLTGRRKGVWSKLIAGSIALVIACSLLQLLRPDSAIWLLVLVAMVMGVPQGLNNLALQNSLYHQANPARMGLSAGLLRTFMYCGAMLASGANGIFLSDGATTAGMHNLAWFMLIVSVLFMAVTITDRSLRAIGSPDKAPS